MGPASMVQACEYGDLSTDTATRATGPVGPSNLSSHAARTLRAYRYRYMSCRVVVLTYDQPSEGARGGAEPDCI